MGGTIQCGNKGNWYDHGFLFSGPTLSIAIPIIGWIVTSLYFLYLQYVMPPGQILGFIPDDAFYGFQMARMKVKSGILSLDGVSPTNGYHPMWMGIMILWSFIADSYVPLLLFQIAINYIGVVLFCYYVGQYLNKYGAGCLALLLCVHPYIILSAFNGLESSALLLLIAVNIAFFISSKYETYSSWILQGVLFGLLFLARTDAVFMVILLSICLLIRMKKSLDLIALKKISVGAICCLCVIAPWLLFNKIQFGSIVQNSGKIFITLEKLYLSFHRHAELLRDRQITYCLLNLTKHLEYSLFLPWFVFYIVSISGGIVLVRKYRNDKSDKIQNLLMIYCVLMGYTFLIAIAGGMRLASREWYYIPAVIVFILSLAVIISSIRNQRFVFFLSAAIAMIILYAGFGPLTKGIWPLQKTALSQLKEINTKFQHHEKVGFTDAGIASYYADFTVVNTDGTVNNNAFEYIQNRRLFDFFKDYGLDYFVSGRGWWQKSWLMGFGTGFRYIHLGNGIHQILNTNEEIAERYLKKEVTINNPEFIKFLGRGWSYPVPESQLAHKDGAWSNISYMTPAEPNFLTGGVWSIGSSSEIYLPLRTGRLYSVSINANPIGHIRGGLYVTIKQENTKIAGIHLTPKPSRTPFSFDVQSSNNLVTKLTLSYSDTVNLKKRGVSEDKRNIALNIDSIHIEEAKGRKSQLSSIH